MSRLTISLVSLVAVTCLSISLPAARATIIHSNVSGATVNFTSISEGSPTGDPEPLFGQPFASGDNLVFPTTSSFTALSNGGGPVDQTSGKLSFIMTAKPGATISAFNYSEGGFTSLDDPFDQGDAFTKVVAFAAIKVLEINNSPVSLPAIQQFLSVSPSGGQYLLSSLGGSSYTTGWSGSMSVPLPAGTTKALVTLDNSLLASTIGTGTGAYIDKTTFAVDIDTVIPEPSTVLLGAAGMLAWSLGSVRRQVRV
jgi:hypothetical protein